MAGMYRHAQLFSTEMGVSQMFVPRLALNLDPPNLNLPSSWDYRCEPQVPAYIFLYLKKICTLWNTCERKK
jgi:hypothetical protein